MKSTMITFTLVSLLAQGCGEGSFTGDTSKGSTPASATAGTADQQPSSSAGPGAEGAGGVGGGGGGGGLSDPADPSKAEGGKVEVRVPTEGDKKAIANCETAWGEKAPAFDKVRVIAANISVLGQGGLIDSRKSEGPELTLVVASVNVLSKLDWELMNPNGWYCIVASVNVLTKLSVTIDKDAHLADSAVAVNVLSQGDGVGRASVNVLSSVQVTKK